MIDMSGGRPRRLRLALAQGARAAWQDLFGEGANGSKLAGSAWAEETQALLAEADARLAELRAARAAALARAHQAEMAWQTAEQAVARQDVGVDEALQASQDSLACVRQRELNLWRGRLEALDLRRRLEADVAGALADAIHSLELQIAAAHAPAGAGPAPLEVLRQTLTRRPDAAGNGKERLA